MKEKIVNLRLTQSKKDGHWLHFEDSKGKKAGINIENTFPEPGIIGSCIRQWARDQFTEEETKECPDCGSPLEDNGACSDVGNNNCQYQDGF